MKCQIEWCRREAQQNSEYCLGHRIKINKEIGAPKKLIEPLEKEFWNNFNKGKIKLTRSEIKEVEEIYEDVANTGVLTDKEDRILSKAIQISVDFSSDY